MSKRTRIIPSAPQRIIHDDAAATIKAAIDLLMKVSKRDDFDVADLTYMYRCDAPRETLQVAVTRLRERGFTWDDIARATGMARSSAYQRWGKPPSDEAVDALGA